MAYFDGIEPGDQFYLEIDFDDTSSPGDDKAFWVNRLDPATGVYNEEGARADKVVHMWAHPLFWGAIESLDDDLERSSYWTNQIRIKEVEHRYANCIERIEPIFPYADSGENGRLPVPLP